MTRVAVAARLRDDMDRVMMVMRRGEPDAARWALPGGTVEVGEAPEEALRRELHEELGVNLLRARYQFATWYEPADAPRTLGLLYDVDVEGEPANAEAARHRSAEWVTSDADPSTLTPTATLALRGGVRERRVDTMRVATADVLLLQPFFPLADREALSLPLGLASLHAGLERVDVSVLSLDCSLEEDYDFFTNDLETVGCRIVGVQFHSAMSYEFALRACARVRRVLPDALIVAGGELATTRCHSLLNSGLVDVVVGGEADETFVELVRVHLRRGRSALCSVAGLSLVDEAGQVVSTPQRPFVADLDELPMPSVEAFRWQLYGQWSLFTSRGCRYRCSYCSSAAFWRHTIRYHSPKRVKAELQRLQNFGATDVYIADDTFTQDRRRVLAICEEIGELGLRWSCLTRVDCVDEVLLTIMAASGCRQISFGFESANDGTLEIVSKRARVSRAERTLDACRDVGIRTRTSVIIPLPGETADDVRRTIDWLERLRPNEVQLYGLTPHDGTALFDNLDALGIQILVEDPMRWSRNVLDPVCATRDLSASAIRELATECVDRLVSRGYTYLTDDVPRKKIGADFTVATTFSPVQSIGPVGGRDAA